MKVKNPIEDENRQYHYLGKSVTDRWNIVKSKWNELIESIKNWFRFWAN